MYTNFYKLREKPFDLTPSPRFLYLGEVHKEALALLTYGVTERKGFILLTGEVGSGKTTIVRALLTNLNIQHIYLSNPLFSTEDFMNYLAFAAFRKRLRFKSKAEFLIEFEEFLKECLQHQKNFILIIDEAQKLSFDLLEEIRLLSNMETADKKLINIFLVGQPELNEKLSQSRCRPLLQRISIRYHIKPLDLGGTQEYMAKRLKIAGAEDVYKIFPKNAIKVIHQCSQGYPRMINILADNALLLGYSREKRRITPAMVMECYEDIKLEGCQPEKTEEHAKPSEVKEVATVASGRYWRWVAVLLIVLAAPFVNTWQGEHIIKRVASLIPVRFQVGTEETATKQAAAVKKESNVKQQKETQEILKVAIKTGVESPKEPQELMEKSNKGVDGSNLPAKQIEMPEELETLAPEEGVAFAKTIIVKEGDTLTALAIKYYGKVDQGILDLIQEKNPDIIDINLIEVGQRIVLPPLTKLEQEPTYTVHIASFKPFQYARNLFQKLMKEGYEVYILPVYDPQKGKIFRVTLGNFKDPEDAKNYISKIKENGVSNYANVMQVETR